MEPFSIQCTTCRRTLRVVSPEAIGQILACPKCGSMVLIEPPTAASETPFSASEPAAPASHVDVPPAVAVKNVPPPAATPIAIPQAEPVAPARAAAAETIPVALLVAEQSLAEQPVIAGRWPWWFWPGVGATIVVSGIILAVRLLLYDGTDGAVESAVASAKTDENTTDENTAIEATVQPVDVNADDTMPEPSTGTAAGEDQPAPDNPLVAVSEDDAPSTPASPPPSPPPAPAEDQAPTATEPGGASPSDQPTAEMRDAPAAVAPHEDEDKAFAAQTTMLRVPPRVVDVDLRLAEPLPSLDARGMPLWAVLELISELSTIPITLDVDAIVARGLSAATPVTVRSASGKTADVLEAVLDPLGLGYQVRDGQLIVGHPEPDELRRIRYTVSDLVGSDEQALAELGALARRMIAPASWQEAGGRGSMAAGGGTLVVEQTDPVHLELLVLCEKLRVARGKSTKSRYDPTKFLLTSRRAKAGALLDHPVTANFSAPQPLAGVVNWLRRATGATIVIDQAALARSGMSQDSQCAVVADKKPLSWLLDELTRPIDLAWRAVDERTIEITTRQAEAQRIDLEFYPVRDLAADAKAGQALAERIMREVEPRAWVDRPSNAVVYFDVPGRMLIVRAAQRLQAEVESQLATWRRK